MLNHDIAAYPIQLGNRSILPIDVIGGGSCGVLWLSYVWPEKKFCAVKIMNDLTEYEDEICHLSAVREKFVPYITHGKISNPQPLGIIVLECLGYTLSQLSEFQVLSKPIIKKLFNILQEFLTIIHTKYNLIHADIKPENIMVRGSPSIDQQVAIDFFESHFGKNPNITMCDHTFREKCLKNFSDHYNQEFCILTESESENESESESESESENKSESESDNESESESQSESENELENESKIVLDQKRYDEAIAQIMNGKVYLIDFGNAFTRSDKEEPNMTTVYYRHPALFENKNPLQRVDKWALGCTLYELEKGKILFDPDRGNIRDQHSKFMKNLGNKKKQPSYYRLFR
jgi:serine/threonine protein kinase